MVLSFLKRRRWPYAKGKRVASIYSMKKRNRLSRKESRVTLSLISKEKKMALSSSELKESPSTFEREEIDPRLFNDKGAVLSSLKKTRWLCGKVRRVASIYFINKRH